MNTIIKLPLRNWLGDEQSDPDKLISLLLQIANKQYGSKELREDVLSYNEDIIKEELREAFDEEE